MKLNLVDRLYVAVMGLLVSHASFLYAVYATRAFAMYLLMSVVGSITFAVILRIGRTKTARMAFKGNREIDKHPEFRDDLDLL
ncbi:MULTISPECIES: hypothetical protein [Acinetobacter]|uniref:Uncharacterized protein n=1 Tax=Acinetobacter indicus TaxID=756892 RepID=A0A6C0Y780_9GAMM|nr:MULTISPECIES: hypothetical protein [Acinetobacter]QIC72101.1 hypothetical protein FSC09_17230 [Acinetobacter indicus]QKQ71498.1 hypothetical protein E5Y90_14800 [Acinetobacter sp. 10FS3-1]